MKLLIQHNQEIAQLSPDPFPLLRAGSGDETICARESERGVCGMDVVGGAARCPSSEAEMLVRVGSRKCPL